MNTGGDHMAVGLLLWVTPAFLLLCCEVRMGIVTSVSCFNDCDVGFVETVK